MLAGSDLGSDDDADLQDLLTSSAALVGKNIAKQQQQQQKASKQCKRGAAGGSGDEDLGLGDSDIEGLRSEDDEGDDVDAGDIMYKDFFGGGGSQQQAESEADSDDDDDADADGLDSDAAEGNDDRQQQQQKGKKAAAAADSKKGIHWYDDADDDDVELSDGEDEQEEEAPLSTHEKRLLRMQVGLGPACGGGTRGDWGCAAQGAMQNHVCHPKHTHLTLSVSSISFFTLLARPPAC